MKLFSSPFPWDRYLAQARVLLGLTALAHELLRRPRSAGFFAVALGVFLVYSVLVAVRQRAHTRRLRAAGAVRGHGILPDPGGPRRRRGPSGCSAAFFLYLLAEGLAFYGPREVAMVVAISGLFCALAPQPQLDLLVRIVFAAGTCGGGLRDLQAARRRPH